jgi:hypothetical protein
MHGYGQFKVAIGALVITVSAVLPIAGVVCASAATDAGRSARSPSAQTGFLSGVAALSARDAWTVGSTSSRTLALHWNGRAWARVASPNPAPDSFLDGVAGSSGRSVWAVGGSGKFPRNKTLILHWNGRAWKRIPSPSPSSHSYGNFEERLRSVAVLSARNT